MFQGIALVALALALEVGFLCTAATPPSARPAVEPASRTILVATPAAAGAVARR